MVASEPMAAEYAVSGSTLSRQYAQMADDELDRLWDEGKINQQVIEGWATEHMRTPYI